MSQGFSGGMKIRPIGPESIAKAGGISYNQGMKTCLKHFLDSQLPERPEAIKKLRGEASTRNFFRLFFPRRSLVAMVYPEPAAAEISRIVSFTRLYTEAGLHVPRIETVIGDRIILMEDLGDLSLQRGFTLARPGQKKKLLAETAEILKKLASIPPEYTAARLDHPRLKWEMDFFITHFARNFLPPGSRFDELQIVLQRLAEAVGPVNTFAHRDFHSRNMMIFNEKVYLVDFQDSLIAAPCYDLVSFAFDAYLDLKNLREFLIERAAPEPFDREQFYLTALERNIKALGTFGYQTSVRKNLSYTRYIPRTIRHITANPLYKKMLQPTLLF